MLEKLNAPTTALAFSLLFIAWMSLYTLTHQEEQGYTHSIFDVLPEPEPRFIDSLLQKVIQVESGGNPKAVSQKGARGLAQIMPATAKHPGFGIAPMQDKSVKEQMRFAGDYLNAMMNRYGNVKLALAAYNCGPRCADSGNFPKETREYINKVLAVRGE